VLASASFHKEVWCDGLWPFNNDHSSYLYGMVALCNRRISFASVGTIILYYELKFSYVTVESNATDTERPVHIQRGTHFTNILQRYSQLFTFHLICELCA
jgi:hypothetical protein